MHLGIFSHSGVMAFDITKADLVVACDKCGGKGQIKDPPGQPPAGSFGAVRVQRTMNCQACGGTGEVLTPAAQLLVEILGPRMRRG
jgi:hypothetical protein